MRLRALTRHASEPVLGAGLQVHAGIEARGSAGVRLCYRLRGDLAGVAIAPAAASRRADRLWERTCFEAFVEPLGGGRYVEVNLAPSTEWAVYAFDGYRAGLRRLELTQPPAIAVERRPNELSVMADVDLSAFAPAPWPWRVGLSAVVAGVGGGRSHWALCHPGAKPDFHDAAGFTLTLEGNAR